ncbi:hypothetical protein AeMF1_017421, partial [Aphanomyces euteiches]
ETPGFARLVHNKALDIPNKYMVVHTWWEDTPVFFHNVYAPVQNQEREAFFDALPRHFPVNAQHIIMGDFNLPLQRELDAMDPSSCHHTGRSQCSQWLEALHVVDAWRLHNPSARVFSSPHGQNRLDYIFMDEDLMRTAYHQSTYFRSPEIVEHICHRVILQPMSQPKRRAYWKLPKELLQVPEVVETIVAEAKQLLPVLRQANNPGVVWAGWKKRAKKFFQEYHVEHLLAKTRVSDLAKRELLRAQEAFDAGRLPPQHWNKLKPSMTRRCPSGSHTKMTSTSIFTRPRMKLLQRTSFVPKESSVQRAHPGSSRR